MLAHSLTRSLAPSSCRLSSNLITLLSLFSFLFLLFRFTRSRGHLRVFSNNNNHEKKEVNKRKKRKKSSNRRTIREINSDWWYIGFCVYARASFKSLVRLLDDRSIVYAHKTTIKNLWITRHSRDCRRGECWSPWGRTVYAFCLLSILFNVSVCVCVLVKILLYYFAMLMIVSFFFALFQRPNRI